MKGFIGRERDLGQLKGMWANFLHHSWNFVSYNIYKIDGDKVKNVHLIFHFETIDTGIALSLDAGLKIQGMFMDDAVQTSHIQTVNLLLIRENEFFINGHQNAGMQDLKIILSNSGLILRDGSMEFKAELICPK